MRRDTTLPRIESSFLSVEKDLETILRHLFVTSQPFSDKLKKLLVINEKDCLDAESDLYDEIMSKTTLSSLMRDGYIRVVPKLRLAESEEVKSYLLISFDNFVENEGNPKFRDHVVTFDIICHPEAWELGDYRLRPMKIAGYIDGILNGCRLSGIGTFQFVGCNELILDENLCGYSLMYMAVTGHDDYIPADN